MGNITEAKYFLRHSGRFGYEYPERIAEAEMAITGNDFDEAKRQLGKAISMNGNILKGHIYMALLETRLGNGKEAEIHLAQASSLDPENPFTSCTDYLMNQSDKSLAQAIAGRYENFPEEILEVVVTLHGAGFREEAFETLKLIRKTNSMVELYKVELEKLTGKELPFIKDKSMAAEFAWRLEEYFILIRSINKNPEDPGPYYHLGNFLYAHDFETEGMDNWEKAYELGYRDKVMLVSLYRAHHKLGHGQKAYEYLLEAYQSDKNDPYVFEYYVDEINKREGVEKAIALMEARYGDFENVYSLKAKLMNAYMINGYYDKLEELLVKSNLHDTHRLSFGEFWKNLMMARGYIKLKEKDYREALDYFTNSTDVPENISQHYFPVFMDRARRLFYMGYCNSKLGKQEKAEELWKEALALKRDSRYQAAYKFMDLKTMYYQAFCLKGLDRFAEAERYVMLLGDYARSTALENNPAAQEMLLNLSILGLMDMDDFEKWDSELGLIKLNANFNAPEE
jgi:tetratricopeptide (TPR) repeat protein